MSTTDQFVDQGIAFLQTQICKLEALKGTQHNVVATLDHAQKVWKDKGWVWLLRESAVLDGEAPIDFLLRGECKVVDDLLSRIDYGIAV
jgi:uncharacterized protein (DUF2384 family)